MKILGIKEIIKKRFAEFYPQKRILCVQLDGFSHRVIYDDNEPDSKVEPKKGMCHVIDYSAYCDTSDSAGKKIFEGIPHYKYQNNPVEIIYIDPRD